MLQLFLQRHGKATQYINFNQDFYRNLDETGINQVINMRNIFIQEQIKIEEILSSSANRAKETAEIMNQFTEVETIKLEKDLFLASSEFILDYIKKEASKENILYVGHNFGISDIVGFLTGDHINLSTSMVVQISFDVDKWMDISSETGKIINTFIP